MAKAVVRAAKERNLEHEEMHSKVEYVVAHGIVSHIGEHRVIIGSYHFVFEDEKCTIPAGYEKSCEGEAQAVFSFVSGNWQCACRGDLH